MPSSRCVLPVPVGPWINSGEYVPGCSAVICGRLVRQAIRIADHERVETRPGSPPARFAGRGTIGPGGLPRVSPWIRWPACADFRQLAVGGGRPVGRRAGRDAKLERQRLAVHFLGRDFQILAKMRPQPILKELIRHLDDERLAAQRHLRERSEPDFVALSSNAVRQPGPNRRHDLPIVHDHIL